MSTTYRPAPNQRETSLAAKHVGIVAGLCLRYWRSLPQDAKRYYDVEDMIGDVVLHVVKRSRRYDKDIAKETTWVHSIAENHCRTILLHYRTQRLSNCTAVDLTPELSKHLQADDTLRLREAINAVERVIARGSDAVLDLVESILNLTPKGGALYAVDSEGRQASFPIPAPDNAVLQDLFRTMRAVNATAEDFVLVVKHC